MKIILIRVTLLFAIAVMTGCAATSPVKQDPVIKDDLAGNDRFVVYRASPWDQSKEIELDCKAASRLGCRHRGTIYPWNAWVELKGYNSINFDVVQVIKSGSNAQVMIVER